METAELAVSTSSELSIFGLFSAIDTHWNPIVTYLGVRLPAIFIMLTLIAKYTQKRANIIVSQNYLLNRNILLAVHLLAILQIYFGPCQDFLFAQAYLFLFYLRRNLLFLHYS